MQPGGNLGIAGQPKEYNQAESGRKSSRPQTQEGSNIEDNHHEKDYGYAPPGRGECVQQSLQQEKLNVVSNLRSALP